MKFFIKYIFLIHCACLGMKIPLDPFLLYFPTASRQSSLSARAAMHGMSDWVSEARIRNAEIQCLEHCQIVRDLSRPVNQDAFNHNFQIITQSLAASCLGSYSESSVLSVSAIQSHMNLVNDLKLFKNSVGYFTKQFLMRYLNIIFDKEGNYKGIDCDNKDDALKLINNYLRTLSSSEEEHAAYLQQLCDNRKNVLLKEVIDYNAEHGAQSLSLSDNYTEIDEQFKSRINKIKNNTHFKKINEILKLCETQQFDTAQQIIDTFANEECIQAQYKDCFFDGEWRFKRQIKAEDRLLTHMRAIIKEARIEAHESRKKIGQEKEQPLITESPQFKMLYGHLENVRALSPEFEKNFGQGVLRALSNDECALCYLEWTKRGYEHILNNRNAVLLQLACNFPGTDMQKKYEKPFIQYLLNFDQRINPSAKAIASMSRGIGFWNAATLHPTMVDDTYLEKVFKSLPEVTVEFSLPTFDLQDIPLTDPLSRSDEHQLVESARYATSEKYEKLPPHADKNDKLLIEATRHAVKSITYHKARPYDSGDSGMIRVQKYNQRYNLALHKFKEASRFIQNPESQQKLFDALMHDVRHEYEKIYKSFPQMLGEQIDATIDHCTELIAKGQFAEFAGLVSSLGELEGKQAEMAVKHFKGELTPQQNKERWTEYFGKRIPLAPFAVAQVLVTYCLFPLKFIPRCTAIIRNFPKILRDAYKVIRYPAEAMAGIRRLMQPQRVSIPSLPGIRQSDEILKMSNSEIPKVPKGPKPIIKSTGAVEEIEKGVAKTPAAGAASEVAEKSAEQAAAGAATKVPAGEGVAQGIARQAEEIAEKAIEVQKDVPSAAAVAKASATAEGKAAQQVATQGEKVVEKAVEIQSAHLIEIFTEEQLRNPTTIPGNSIIEKFKQEVIEKAVKKAMEGNKINHIFVKPMHNLDVLVEKLGNNENVVRAIIKELQGKVFHNEIFQDIKINVEGFEIYVRGRMMNGAPLIGTFFIKK